MTIDFHTWLIQENGLNENTATSRVSNIKRIEKYYGSIDMLIQKGLINNLLKDLSYSKEDERNNRLPAHKIPICGDKTDSIYNGSATLKQALELYLKYYNSANAYNKGTTQTLPTSVLKTIFINLKNSLTQFRVLNTKISYSPSDVKNDIQQPLLNSLQVAMPLIKWKMEFKPDHVVGDKIDIFGKVSDNAAIIIEIDTYRSDQISKKYVSRQALCKDMNIIYVVVTYPNNNSKSEAYKNEFDKYKKYLYNLTAIIEKGSGLEKYLYIHQL